MNNSFSLQQIQKTSNLDANLKSEQYKLNLMAHFIRMKYENPKIKQSEKTLQLIYSSSTLQRYRNDINMLSPYRIQPNNTNKRSKKVSNTKFDNNSHRESDLKRPQMTSNDLVKPETNTKSEKKNKTILKGGSIHETIEINDQNLDEILDNNVIFMDLAMVIVSTDKTVRSETIQD